jgi:hypothetical protein
VNRKKKKKKKEKRATTTGTSSNTSNIAEVFKTQMKLSGWYRRQWRCRRRRWALRGNVGTAGLTERRGGKQALRKRRTGGERGTKSWSQRSTEQGEPRSERKMDYGRRLWLGGSEKRVREMAGREGRKDGWKGAYT